MPQGLFAPMAIVPPPRRGRAGADGAVFLARVTRIVLIQPHLGVEDVARSLKIGRHALERRIRTETSMSYQRWRQHVLMDWAVVQLLTSEEPLKCLASRLSYGSTKAFSRAFEQIKGLRPSEFRRCAGKDEGSKQ